MNIVLAGPPGCGKGTLAKRMVDELNMVQISAGDIIRAAKSQGRLPQDAILAMQSGQLIPDDITIALMSEFISEVSEGGQGLIFDGFPRSLDQIPAFKTICQVNDIHIPFVVELHVPDDMIVRRIMGRYSCGKCGAIYNSFFAPAPDGVCVCGHTEFTFRDDDNEVVARDRLKLYHDVTQPVLATFDQTHRIDASKDLTSTLIDVLKLAW